MMLPILCMLLATQTYAHDNTISCNEPGATITTTIHTTETTTTTLSKLSSKITTVQKTERTTTSTTTNEDVQLQLTSCNKTFVNRNINPNSISTNNKGLLGHSTAASSELDCTQQCCENELCCKVVYTQNGECLTYSYVKDSELPITPGATVLQEKCCYDGEQIMGEVTLHPNLKNLDEAEAACKADNMTLAMPKTQCAYNILTQLTEAKRYKMEDFYWIGMRNPTGRTYIYNDGDTPENHGFQLPIAPAEFDRDNEEDGLLWFRDGRWMIGDWQGHNRLSFLCQSNTS